MSDYSQALQVEGLRPFREALKTAGDQFPKELAKANKLVAELVAEKARVTARSQGSTAAKSADSIRATGGQLSSSVRLGDVSHPYALGAEFGAAHNVPRETARGMVRG